GGLGGDGGRPRRRRRGPRCPVEGLHQPCDADRQGGDRPGSGRRGPRARGGARGGRRPRLPGPRERVTEPGKAQVRRATRSDVDAVVAVHLEAFGDAFLARLGPRFLKLYYEVLLDAPGGVLLVGEDPELGIVAFAAGAT